jgi:hypothetical protein
MALSERCKIVSDLEDAWDVIEEFSYETHTYYVTTRTTRNFGMFDAKGTYYVFDSLMV